MIWFYQYHFYCQLLHTYYFNYGIVPLTPAGIPVFSGAMKRGPKLKYEKRITLPLSGVMLDKIDSALTDSENRLDFIRDAITAELKKRYPDADDYELTGEVDNSGLMKVAQSLWADPKMSAREIAEFTGLSISTLYRRLGPRD
uniref:Uncharacterized protein n=1 Tax=Ochrobactrum sp. LM19 TaxID=1449781 RepID=A0A0D5A0B0_9HYPH|nr:winged helix-turn-helix domain-containing protein [Ochrobactrum sp. LM19]AJW29977.1 hypothetical protein pLM19O2_p32 [Ochrobactrum sp. LM19]